MKIGIVITLLVLLLAQSLFAADVKLSWDPSASPGVTGYKVYMGNASRTYGTPTKIGNVTTYTVPNLANGTWYFAVTATDNAGNESGFSNEVVKTITTLQPPTNATGEIVVNITITVTTGTK